MVSLPVWLPGPMFGLWGSLSRGVSVQEGVSVQGGSLSRVVSVQGVLCPGRLPPPDRDSLYGEERAVRILLECILVFILYSIYPCHR